jgi:hypothetical protein
MNRSVSVTVITPRAKRASKNEIAFGGRLAARPNPLPASTARRSLQPLNPMKLAHARRAKEYKQAVPARSVSRLSINYFRLAKKIYCTTKDKNKLSNGL